MTAGTPLGQRERGMRCSNGELPRGRPTGAAPTSSPSSAGRGSVASRGTDTAVARSTDAVRGGDGGVVAVVVSGAADRGTRRRVEAPPPPARRGVATAVMTEEARANMGGGERGRGRKQTTLGETINRPVCVLPRTHSLFCPFLCVQLTAQREGGDARTPTMLSAASRHPSRLAAAAARLLATHAAGQPTHTTHPHALARGELAPGVAAVDIAARRAALVEAAGLPPGGVALLPAAPRTFVAGVIPHPYRPDADFAHFTGVTQPGCIAAIVAGAGGGSDGGSNAGGRLIMFVPDGNARAAAWDGAPLTPGAAVTEFGAENAYPMSEVRCGKGG